MAKKEKKEKKEEKKKGDAKIVLERSYNIPLRKEWLKSPKYKRSKKAVSALRKFLSKHMKSDNIKIGKHLNEQIWSRGIKNPPHHVKVDTVKDEENVVRAELSGFPIETPESKDKKQGKDKLEDKLGGKGKKEEKGEKGEKGKEVKKEKKEGGLRKLTERFRKKPELAEEAVEEPKELKEEQEADKVSEDIEKEELGDMEKVEEEEEIKEAIKEIKEPSQEKTQKKAKPKAEKK